MRRRRPTDLRDDSGVTLAELIVYSLLLAIVVAIVGTVLIRTLMTERDTAAVSQANNASQVAFSQLQHDLRNAASAKVSGSGHLLVVTTRVATKTSDNEWKCVGYYLDDATGDLRRVADAGGTRTAAAAAATTASALKTAAGSWPSILTKTKGLTAGRPFGPSDAVVPGGQTVSVGLSTTTIKNRKPIEFSTLVNMRKQNGAPNGCF